MKAKYFNGTNVLDRGVSHVLSDEALVNISLLKKLQLLIPLQLTGNEKAVTGFLK